MGEFESETNHPDIPESARPALDTYVQLNGEMPTGESLNRILAFLDPRHRSTATEEELIEFLNSQEQL